MNSNEAFKALSNQTRLQILTWLKEPEKHFPRQQEAGDVCDVGVCVTDIQEKAGFSQSTVSQYLSTLQKAGLVTSQRIGQWTYYKRNEENIGKLIEFIKLNL